LDLSIRTSDSTFRALEISQLRSFGEMSRRELYPKKTCCVASAVGPPLVHSCWKRPGFFKVF